MSDRYSPILQKTFMLSIIVISFAAVFVVSSFLALWFSLDREGQSRASREANQGAPR